MTPEDGTIRSFPGPVEGAPSSLGPRQEVARRAVYQTPTLTAVSNLFEVVGKGTGTKDIGLNGKPST